MYTAQVGDLLAVSEAAKAVGVTDRSVRRWIGAGLLAAEGTGRRRRVRLGDVEALRDRSHNARALRRREEAIELRGRYEELRDRVRELEIALAEERRENGWLKARLDRAAA